MAVRRLSVTQLLQRWLALVTAHGRAQGAAAAATTAAVQAAWVRLDNPYDRLAEEAFAQAAADAVRAGRGRANDLMDAHMRRVLQVVELEPVRARPVANPEPRGLPIEAVMARAAKQYRYEKSQGRGEEEARASGRNRAVLAAQTDLQMAARDAFSQISKDDPRIIGWRRIVHPELPGDVCGLCIAAATRIYRVDELMPIHDRCKCTQLPVVKGVPDLGQRINGVDLMDLYVQIGETGRDELAKVRVRTVDHGEVGPKLVLSKHHFRGPEEVIEDADPETPLGVSA